MTLRLFRFAPNELPPASKVRALPKRPFKAVAVIDGESNDQWRTSVCEWLANSGCVFFMAWGRDCKEWHDAMDDVSIERRALAKRNYIVTTWHEDESLSEVFWFSKFCAFQENRPIYRTAIVHVSDSTAAENLLGLYEAVRSDDPELGS